MSILPWQWQWQGQAQAPRTAGAGGGGGGGAQLDLAPQDGVHKYVVAVAALENKDDVAVEARYLQEEQPPQVLLQPPQPQCVRPQNPQATARPSPVQEREGSRAKTWQTPTCAKVALEHYNRSNEDEYEMVKALYSVSSFFNGVWVHVNFLAKLKGATQCPDLVPKFFFAEVKSDFDGRSCVSCVKIDTGNPEATPIRGCGICQNNEIYHPAVGGHRGDRKSAS
ncbi:uncharacterized protein LOC127768361 isoform X1 [Oryza glaberrima]|uniref:uncharacterized protein LOC127768361 isoform X1 n=1 Tax=Oryza glaberrima TaxID=4538 RepID=UPI00023E05DC|nr:uncharacterized protein LOC127768361 isoform X1 [Oryza glaberrima]